MPGNQTAPSADVQQLIDEGYTVIVHGQHLIIDNVPYLSSPGVISRAAIISTYVEVNGVYQVRGEHTVWFTGSMPCDAEGTSLANSLVAGGVLSAAVIAGRNTTCQLSNKPDPIGDMLDNFYNKMMHYIRKLTSYARAVDPNASAIGSGSFSYTAPAASVFHYPNTAVVRAGLEAYEAKLVLAKVAIVGTGGTGAYILDALAKTPVKEIHLYDGDAIEEKNAFRLPGALTIGEALGGRPKTDILVEIYDQMRIGVVGHPYRIEAGNLIQLNQMNFVFIAVDHGPSRGLIANHLLSQGIPFIDVGIGVDKVPEATQLLARARVTLVTAASAHVVSTMPVADDTEEAVYNNIQLVELNALNAMLAIIKYKQFLGFYVEEIVSHELRYSLSWNQIVRATAPLTIEGVL